MVGMLLNNESGLVVGISFEQLPTTHGIAPQLIKYLHEVHAPETCGRRFELGGYKFSVTFLIDGQGYVKANIKTDPFQDFSISSISPAFLKQLREAIDQILNDVISPYVDLRNRVNRLLCAGLIEIPAKEAL
ncbi:MAG: hypothetical protein HPY52_11190 [Firmicutes bacterium]|nr:hypothetical protein [Bacillota bacterium]